MELDITEFFNACAPMDFSASVAEIGNDAGPTTWRAACEESENLNLLNTDEKREAFKAFVRSSGGWTAAEIAAWSDLELQALCIQWIAGDMREPCGFELNSESTDAEWSDYEQQCESGKCAGRIFRGDNGRVYFSLEG